MRENANFPIVGSDPTGAPVPAGEPDGLAVDGAITEAELARRIAQGGAIREAVVIYRPPDQIGGGAFTPYLRLTDRRAFLAIATYRERSIRSFKDFSRLLAALDGWGYRGPVRVVWDGDPELGRLQLTGATPPAG